MLKFGSVEAMHLQLAHWGVPAWLAHGHEDGDVVPKARGGGQQKDIPPASNAMSIFQRTIEMLSVFVERSPGRKEHRQGERFVVTYAKPLLEAPEPGENHGYIESTPDTQQEEHGVVRFTLDQAYRRVAGGASRHPDEDLTAAVAAALLTGEPPDTAHIPPGCRFHPCCPVLRSGEAGSQEPRCLGEVPALEEPLPGHRAACYVAAAGGVRTL